MRIFTTRRDAATDPESLWQELLKRPGASATPELVKALNPHLDFNKNLAAGSVLLIPDAGDVKAGAGTAIASDDVDAVIGDVDDGLEAARKRVRAGVTQREADRSTIVSALKSAPSKRLIESDPVLKKQIETADAQYKADQKRAAEVESQLAEVQKVAMDEFDRLRKMLVG